MAFAFPNAFIGCHEIQRVKPRDAPRPVLTTLTGSHQPIITLAFQDATSSATPSRIPIRALRHVNEKYVLVKLTLYGESHDFLEAFERAIRDLPANMQVEVRTHARQTSPFSLF